MYSHCERWRPMAQTNLPDYIAKTTLPGRTSIVTAVRVAMRGLFCQTARSLVTAVRVAMEATAALQGMVTPTWHKESGAAQKGGGGVFGGR